LNIAILKTLVFLYYFKNTWFKNYFAKFVENSKIYFKEVLQVVNEIDGIINFGKFSHTYDSLYLGITFWGTRCVFV